MSDVFLISDTHFGHKGMCEFLNHDGSKVRPWDNPNDMDKALIENWNSVVKSNDKVYHLGDVAIPKRHISIMEQLNGKKILIKGNHDIFSLKDYIPYFKDIRGSHKLDNFILSHIPIHKESLTNRWCEGNIHGHMHNNIIDDPLYFNVSVERINYTPIPIEVVFRKMRNNK